MWCPRELTTEHLTEASLWLKELLRGPASLLLEEPLRGLASFQLEEPLRGFHAFGSSGLAYPAGRSTFSKIKVSNNL